MPLPGTPKAVALLIVIILSLKVDGQVKDFWGIVKDGETKLPIKNASVMLIKISDSLLMASFRTDDSGKFTFNDVIPDAYELIITYPGMADYRKYLDSAHYDPLKGVEALMSPQGKILEVVIVRSAKSIRVKGDTVEYIADSFPVKKGQSVEELLKVLPGVSVERNGKITAQGKEVAKILVDGEEFFTDDPKLTSRGLIAETIGKVQIYDMDRYNSSKSASKITAAKRVINVTLKPDKNNGYFGKLSFGTSFKKYFDSENLGAFYKGNRKVSAYGMFSNTASNNSSFENLDKLNYTSIQIIADGTNEQYYLGEDGQINELNSDFGLPTILTSGFQFSDKWKKKTESLNINYKLKNNQTSGWQNGIVEYQLPNNQTTKTLYTDTIVSHTFKHHTNVAYVLPIDSLKNKSSFPSNKSG